MRNKLELLEFGRGMAAFAVVLCHVHWYLVTTPDYLHFVWPWGDRAVKFFFVLSGFIIYFVNGHEIGAGSAQTFAWRRFVRIFPTYWLIFLSALALREFAGNSYYAIQVTPDFLAANLFLLPSHGLFIEPAWSLRHELLFYAVFLVCIWNARVGIALASFWLGIVLFGMVWFGLVDERGRTLWNTISSPLNLLFLLGIGFAVVMQRFKLAYLLAKGPPLSAWFGRISYPLYLCHLPIFLVTHGILKRLGHFDVWPVATALGISLSLATATLIAHCFERPLLSERGKRIGENATYSTQPSR